MIEEDIYSKLNTGIATVAGRIYPEILPQNPSYPSVTYRRDGSSRFKTYNEGSTNVIKATYFIDSWSGSYKAAKELAVEIRTTLNNQDKQLWGATWIDSCQLESDLDTYEQGVEAYRTTLIFNITYKEI